MVSQFGIAAAIFDGLAMTNYAVIASVSKAISNSTQTVISNGDTPKKHNLHTTTMRLIINNIAYFEHYDLHNK